MTLADVGTESSLKASPGKDDRAAERKLGFLRRRGLFGEDLHGCVIERACRLDDLRQAYRLVHDVYLGRGFIAPDPSGMRVRIFETTTETATFVAKVEGRVVGVLSVVQDSDDLGLPSDAAFKPELDALRQRGARLCEVTNQAVAKEYRNSAVPTELMRCAIAVSLSENADEAVAAVSPCHQGFYDLLGFRQIGSFRSYSATINDPVVAVSMGMDQYREPEETVSATTQFVRQFLTSGNRFLECMTEWQKEARRQFLDADLLRKLFVLEKNFLAMCTPEELNSVRQRWGQEIFAAVMGDACFSGAAANQPANDADNLGEQCDTHPFAKFTEYEAA